MRPLPVLGLIIPYGLWNNKIHVVACNPNHKYIVQGGFR
jgi:hypothetical protein